MLDALAERNSLVQAKLSMARSAALWAKRRLPSHIQFDDLYQSACLGLIGAANSFDPSRQTPFEVYARKRVYGAAIDPFRGRQYRDYKHKQLPESLATVEPPDAERRLGNHEMRELLKHVLQALPTKAQDIILLRYWKDMPMDAIARDCRISVYRAHKLHAHAMEDLRHALERRMRITIQGPGRVSDLLLPSVRAIAEQIWTSRDSYRRRRGNAKRPLLLGDG